MPNNSKNIENKTEVGRLKQRSAFCVKTTVNALPPRLQKRSEFLAVAAANKKFVTSGFILQCGAPFDEKRMSKIGYTASRRVGGAIERNKVKRKMRELVRLVLASKIDDGRDYVMVGRKAAIKRPFAVLIKDAENILSKMQAK